MSTLVAPLLLGWFFIANLSAFFLMWLDKRRAKSSGWRIPEKTLFLPVLLGGSLGGILGMKCFRHKTLHWYFVWGFRGIFIAQVFLGIFVYCKFFV